MPNKVVNLGEVRDILADWEKVRPSISQGRIKGFALTVIDDHGRETVFYGGLYRTDSNAQARASIRMSWTMTKLSGTPKP